LPVSDLLEAQVTRVVDGDTIHVAIDGVEYRLRYIGIDTPEINDPEHGVEPFGPEATEANRELVEGKSVLLEKDVSETDKFGRLLRYVYVGDLMVNEELLRQGLARVATFPPDVKYVDRFLAAQRAAQDAGRGIWGGELSAAEGASNQVLAWVLPHEVWSYTYQQPDGNRLVRGRGAVPGVQPLDISLDGQPQWLVGAPLSEGSVWAAILVDGRVQAFRVVGQQVELIPITPTELPPLTPPLLRTEDDVPHLVTAPTAGASSMTHPAILNVAGERLAFAEATGDLVIWDGGEIGRLAVGALTDGRMLVDESGRILLLTDATTRYEHGVLGDGVEAARITLVETSPALRVAGQITLNPPGVVEGIAPIWTDWTGDGKREIIVTLSDAQQGARVVVFSEAGVLLASGPAIGRGYRWRHQIAVGPFGPDGELELADVRTPHIGGVVEFYRLVRDQLQIVAQVPGYTSHVLGSRNLDMTAAGDFDGDGRLELLLPDQARTSLGAIRRNPGGAEVAWKVSLGERMSTNLAAVVFPDGTLGVGAGHVGNKLRLWLP
jgi:endonuclease YncB( thermonuclease family)